MKKSRLVTGQRVTPSWVAQRVEDRPPWRCRTGDEQDWFMEFVIEDLKLRLMQHGAQTAGSLVTRLAEPLPTDRRAKPWFARAFDDAEQAARAVPLIREVFEDYWAEGRDAGRLYRRHDPTAEMIAAKFAGVPVEEVEKVLKWSKAKRPSLE